jgi:2,4-dienoyl-CoA reductase-like NADH-dependent reductase (Old Yellow Enzyme family)
VAPSFKRGTLDRPVKAATNLPTVAVGLIADYDQADIRRSLELGRDFVALARTILYDPRWPWHAAAHFGADVKAPKQHSRLCAAQDQGRRLTGLTFGAICLGPKPCERGETAHAE